MTETSFRTPRRTRRPHRTAAGIALILAFFAGTGCDSGMARIDRATDQLIRRTSEEIGGGSVAPMLDRAGYYDAPALRYPADRDVMRPGTVNPAASELTFRIAPPEETAFDPAVEAQEAIARLEQARTQGPGFEAMRLDLAGALTQAMRTGRDYRTAEEEYVLAALRLLIERHLWGPRFFNDVSATLNAAGDDSFFNTSLSLVNEFRVTQRLPYGGDVSARLLARATEDLHRRIAGRDVQSAEIILQANVPLLRGAGQSARESRIQAERALIYAARRFEQFRRDYLVSIATDFLNLMLQQQAITNSENDLKNRLSFLEREQSLTEAGRARPFNAALAANNVLAARNRLAGQIDSLQFAIDRFKVRLGLSPDQEIVILPQQLDLPTPEINAEQAVRDALSFRLDLQTQRDQLDDSRRSVEAAKNNLLPDLDVFARASIPTDDERDRAGLRFNVEDNDYSAGVTFGLPLDREMERMRLRQAQIAYEQSQRNYDRFRDNIVIEVRAAVRDIERAVFVLRLQEENLKIAQLRQDSIEAAPDRATALERSEAANALIEAADARDRAARDLQVAILDYLNTAGTLRVDEQGQLVRLRGMEGNGGPKP